MTSLMNEICELRIEDLGEITGGTWMDTVGAVTSAIKALNDIQCVLGKAVEDLAPIPCHPK